MRRRRFSPTFADEKSDARQQDDWEDYSKLAAAKKKGDVIPAVYQQTRDAWMAAHPAGYLEYRAALGPKGQVRRLASRQVDRRQSSTALS